MKIRSATLAGVFTAAFALSLAVAVPGASAFQCEDQVNQALQDQGINQNDVKSVDVVKRSAGARSPSSYTLDAWVYTNSCSNGAVVVSMTKYCMVQDAYTTGDCSVGTMPNY